MSGARYLWLAAWSFFIGFDVLMCLVLLLDRLPVRQPVLHGIMAFMALTIMVVGSLLGMGQLNLVIAFVFLLAHAGLYRWASRPGPGP